MFIGPVAAASFAGLLGLISGFDLGRYFTLPLMFSLAGVSGLFLPGLLEGSGVKIDGEVLGVLYLWWIIVIGGIGGGILMSIIPGYTRYSRIWAAAGMFVMFVIWYIVTAIDEQNPGVSKSPMIFNFRLTGLPLLLSFGGAVGAAVGSIIDHLTGREEYRPLWVTCPHCGLRFCLDEADQWDGKRHLQCGKRVHIGFA
jgi:hypothetical protein